jgi:hypothetical protein
MTTWYWLRYGFLLVLLAAALWMAWLGTADARQKRRQR